MNGPLASIATVMVGAVLLASGHLPPGIAAYHLLCAITIVGRRARLRTFFRGGRSPLLWTAGTTLVIVGVLLLAPLIRDPAPYRGLFLRTLFPWGNPRAGFALFAVYPLLVHAPLEEIFWRGVVMDPEWSPPRLAVPGNAVFF